MQQRNLVGLRFLLLYYKTNRHERYAAILKQPFQKVGIGQSDMQIITQKHTPFLQLPVPFVSDDITHVRKVDCQAGCYMYMFTVCFLFIHSISYIQQGGQNVRNTSHYRRVEHYQLHRWYCMYRRAGRCSYYFVHSLSDLTAQEKRGLLERNLSQKP